VAMKPLEDVDLDVPVHLLQGFDNVVVLHGDLFSALGNVRASKPRQIDCRR
jgi:hypothetical protein